MLKVCKTCKKHFVDDCLIVDRLKTKEKRKVYQLYFPNKCVASSTFFKSIFSQLMKQFILVKVLKVIPRKDSTDIDKVCFTEFFFMRNYLKITLKRPSFVMGISVSRKYKPAIKRLRKLFFRSNYESRDSSRSQPCHEAEES